MLVQPFHEIALRDRILPFCKNAASQVHFLGSVLCWEGGVRRGACRVNFLGDLWVSGCGVLRDGESDPVKMLQSKMLGRDENEKRRMKNVETRNTTTPSTSSSGSQSTLNAGLWLLSSGRGSGRSLCGIAPLLVTGLSPPRSVRGSGRSSYELEEMGFCQMNMIKDVVENHR